MLPLKNGYKTLPVSEEPWPAVEVALVIWRGLMVSITIGNDKAVRLTTQNKPS